MARGVTGRRLLRQSKNKANNERDVTRMGGRGLHPKVEERRCQWWGYWGNLRSHNPEHFKEWESARVLML